MNKKVLATEVQVGDMIIVKGEAKKVARIGSTEKTVIFRTIETSGEKNLGTVRKNKNTIVEIMEVTTHE